MGVGPPTSLARQQSQQTSVSEGAGSRTGSIRARREREREEQGGAIPRHSSIGSAATTASLGSSHGSAGGAAAVSLQRPQRPSRPPRLSAPIREVPGSSMSFREVAAVIPENRRVDAGTSTTEAGSDGVMQNRLEEVKTPTDSTGSSSESWFATLFRSASLR